MGEDDVVGTGSYPPGPRYFCCSNHVDLYAVGTGSFTPPVLYCTLDNGQVLEFIFQPAAYTILTTGGGINYFGGVWIWINNGQVSFLPSAIGLVCNGYSFQLASMNASNLYSSSGGVILGNQANLMHQTCNPFFLRFGPIGGLLTSTNYEFMT
jgi:hypothetical protein